MDLIFKWGDWQIIKGKQSTVESNNVKKNIQSREGGLAVQNGGKVYSFKEGGQGRSLKRWHQGKDLKRMKKRDMNIWRKSILVSGTTSAKTLAWDVPSVFREGQGGQCSWNGVSEGREGGDVFAEVWREDRSGYSRPPEGPWLYSGWDVEPKRGFWAEEEGIRVTLAAELTTDYRGVRVESGDQLRNYWSSQVREHGSLDQGGSDGNGESQ